MAVSKRVRFEVLRRDNHQCRYCHSSDNPLTVDHVVPTALGGTDDPGNLVAACKDCNAGKASTSPDEHLVAQVDEDSLRWMRARGRAIANLTASRQNAAERREPFLRAWCVWDKDGGYLPVDWYHSVDRWLDEGITVDQLIEAIDITLPKRHISHREVFRYVSGIVRNWIAEIDRATTDELAAEGSR